MKIEIIGTRRIGKALRKTDILAPIKAFGVNPGEVLFKRTFDAI